MLDRLARNPALQLLLVIAVAAAVYLPFLGTRPLDFSEGHRAVPGWTMLESGDYWHVKMFGLTYIRKPPGMPWAIALSSSIFGENTFGARFPSALSAICMSGLAWWYGRRWFAGTAGLIAGLSQALMPLMWSPGRTAEIEMLNNLGTQMLALGLIDILIARARRPGAESQDDDRPFGFLAELCDGLATVLIPAAGLMIAGLAKGPASAPVLGGVLIGACLATRSIRTLANRRLGIVLILAGGLLTLLGMKIYLANAAPDAVREDISGQFLWNAKRVLGVATLIPVAIASALPMSLSLLPRSLWRKPEGSAVSPSSFLWLTPEALCVCRTLALAWLCALLILVVSGVSNARYAMPAAVLLPPLVPFAAAALRPWLDAVPSRRKIVGTPLRWGLLMGLAAWWFLVLTAASPSRDQLAGIEAADRLASPRWAGPVWANDAIEARPDILWIAEALRGAVQWRKAEMLRAELPPKGSHLLLRTDTGSSEGRTYQARIDDGTLRPISSAAVRHYLFTFYRVDYELP